MDQGIYRLKLTLTRPDGAEEILLDSGMSRDFTMLASVGTRIASQFNVIQDPRIEQFAGETRFIPKEKQIGPNA